MIFSPFSCFLRPQTASFFLSRVHYRVLSSSRLYFCSLSSLQPRQIYIHLTPIPIPVIRSCLVLVRCLLRRSRSLSVVWHIRFVVVLFYVFCVFRLVMYYLLSHCCFVFQMVVSLVVPSFCRSSSGMDVCLLIVWLDVLSLEMFWR
jgi:hypothetical protein